MLTGGGMGDQTRNSLLQGGVVGWGEGLGLLLVGLTLSVEHEARLAHRGNDTIGPLLRVGAGMYALPSL